MDAIDKAIKSAGGHSSDDIRSGMKNLKPIKSIIGDMSFPHDQQMKASTKIGEINGEMEYETVHKTPTSVPEKNCSYN